MEYAKETGLYSNDELKELLGLFEDYLIDGVIDLDYIEDIGGEELAHYYDYLIDRFSQELGWV